MTDQPKPLADALQLAATGYTLPQIARAMHCDETAAAAKVLQAVQHALAGALTREQARTVEVAHLDMLRRSLTPAALRGDVGAARMLVRIHTSRALLLNLIDHEPPADVEDEVNELDRIRERRDARRSTAH